MPYVKKEQRKDLDSIVESAFKIYKEEDGRLYWDYILIKFAERNIVPGYNRYKNFLAEVTESAFEMERRFHTTSALGSSQTESVFIPSDQVFVILDIFVEKLRGLGIDGDLNYILFAFGRRIGKFDILRKSRSQASYILQLKNTVGYIRKTILASYEDRKIEENGDVI